MFIAMKRANIAELRNRLSYYLRFVRRGQSVMVLDRQRVIARIDPVRNPDEVAESSVWPGGLIQSGVLRAPRSELKPGWLARRPAARANVVSALLAERETGR
jgi:antitoxin (DNA-binding transcriptional repressor) of toxin-antitoxin stability system